MSCWRIAILSRVNQQYVTADASQTTQSCKAGRATSDDDGIVHGDSVITGYNCSSKCLGQESSYKH